MFKLFNLGGPSVTGINVSIQSLNLSARTFALMILFGEVLRIWTPDWIGAVIKGLVITFCVIRFVVPERKSKDSK